MLLLRRLMMTIDNNLHEIGKYKVTLCGLLQEAPGMMCNPILFVNECFVNECKAIYAIVGAGQFDVC